MYPLASRSEIGRRSESLPDNRNAGVSGKFSPRDDRSRPDEVNVTTTGRITFCTPDPESGWN
jgi:hypothetical protein